jgi:DNA replication protein DnaC
MLQIVDQSGPIWTVECDGCDFLAGLPAREVDASMRNVLVVERRRKSSAIPAELRGLPLPGGHGGAEVAARSWARGERRGLALTGSVGVGKSYMAAAAAWARMEHGPLRWVFVPRLFNRLALAFDNEQRREALDLLVQTGGLVLDDIDKTRPTENAAEQLLCAIDERVTAGAPLLVTTNLTLSALADRFPDPYGEAIVSRLVGYCEVFAIEGPDRRLEAAVAS